MEQTVVEFLENQYNSNGKLTPVDFYQAKEMENKMFTEQQVDDAYDKGFKDASERIPIDINEKWSEYRIYTNNEDAWCFKEWLVEQFKKK
jgi:hypothetical protein